METRSRDTGRDASRDHPAALLRLRLGGRVVPVLPARSVSYFAWSVAVLIVVAILLDAVVIARLERSDRLEGPEWARENDIRETNMERRNESTDEDWIWRSRGWPVSRERRLPRRILVMGDSFVWGSGCANVNDTWWRQLERELRRRGHRDVEVIAAGRNGSSTRDQLEQARRLVPAYRPDLIIWGYVANDPDERVIRPLAIDPHRYDEMDAVHRALDGTVATVAIPHLAAQLRAARRRVLEPELSRTTRQLEYSAWELALLQGENFERYRETVRMLGEFQRETGIPGFVMTLPNAPDRARFEARYAPVEPLFRAAGLDFVDALPEFVAQYPDGRPPRGGILGWGINPANAHPGPAATQFLAARAADHLERRHEDVLGGPGIPQPPRVNDWIPFDLDVTPVEGGYDLAWPAGESAMPILPDGEPHVQLSFDEPAPVTALRLEGPDLRRARVRVTTVGPLGFDDGTLHDLGERSGPRAEWSVELPQGAGAVNTIHVSAEFSGTSRRARLGVSLAEEPQ